MKSVHLTDYKPTASRCKTRTFDLFSKPYVYVVNRGIFPDFREEYIQKLVDTLYQKKEIEAANEICRLYRLKGYVILDEIYKKHQSDQGEKGDQELLN